MKNIIHILFPLFLFPIFVPAYAAENCITKSSTEATETLRVEATQARSQLKDARILVQAPDGRIVGNLPANEYAVVRRQRTIKDTKVLETTQIRCSNTNKNLFMVGVRKDHKGLTKEASGSSARVISEQGPVLDASYMRQDLLGPIGAGAGIDTNGKPRVFLGIGF